MNQHNQNYFKFHRTHRAAFGTEFEPLREDLTFLQSHRKSWWSIVIVLVFLGIFVAW